ncbi:MAG: L,D-transpeptidase [Bacillota bacterium]
MKRYLVNRVWVWFTLALVLFATWPVRLPPAMYEDHIVVDKSLNKLYLYREGRLIRQYDVGTGREVTFTPEGRFSIVSKQKDPVGFSENPDVFGTRWMGLDAGGRDNRFGIHGTDDESTIGRHVSHGCVRMRNRDVEELFEMVDVGTPVIIRRGSTVRWYFQEILSRLTLEARLLSLYVFHNVCGF